MEALDNLPDAFRVYQSLTVTIHATIRLDQLGKISRKRALPNWIVVQKPAYLDIIPRLKLGFRIDLGEVSSYWIEWIIPNIDAILNPYITS